MDRIDSGLLVVVLASVVLGGTVAANFTGRLQSFGAAPLIEEQVTTEITDTRVEDQRLYLDVKVGNPTRYELRLTGVFVRVYNETDSRLAWGSATPVGEERVVPARGALDTRLELRLTPEQADSVAAALRNGGFDVTGRQAFRLGDTELTVTISPVHVAEKEVQGGETETRSEEREVQSGENTNQVLKQSENVLKNTNYVSKNAYYVSRTVYCVQKNESPAKERGSSVPTSDAVQ